MASETASARAEVSVYRPFFFAGIATVLTVGCLLGAVSLLGIAGRGNYATTEWTPFVLAHANSQLFGWVGFFVMGFAMQEHATSIRRRASFHRVAYAALALMASGIALRFVAEPMASTDPAHWVPVGQASGWMQLAAVLLFCYNTGPNRYRTGGGLTWQTSFILASLCWMVLAAAIDPFVFSQIHQADTQASVLFIAHWMNPIREVQFLGFVAMMIFGVALSRFHEFFGFPAADRGIGLFGFGAWTAGLTCRVIGWDAFFRSGMEPGRDIFYRAGAALLCIGAVAVASSVRVFEPAEKPVASLKFLRGSIAWLILAGLMLVAEPVVLARAGIPFSHAYTGAVRHAVTVGFISQMILGVGWHVAAKLGKVDRVPEHWLMAVWLLVNAGNLARVGFQVATVFSPDGFVPMGLTGMIELAGLVVWAVLILRAILSA